jgi:hypothetical protein
MRQTGHKTNRNAGRDIRRSQVRNLAHTGSPHDATPDDTNDELSTSDEPMGVDHVGGLLVVDIVEGVSCVPGDNEADLRRYGEVKEGGQEEVL